MDKKQIIVIVILGIIMYSFMLGNAALNTKPPSNCNQELFNLETQVMQLRTELNATRQVLISHIAKDKK